MKKLISKFPSQALKKEDLQSIKGGSASFGCGYCADDISYLCSIGTSFPGDTPCNCNKAGLGNRCVI